MKSSPATIPTPYELGFRMPAEWEPHKATWLAWPHERTDWPGKFAPIPWVYGDIARKLSRVERVRILVEDAATQRRAQRVLAKCGANLRAVEFFRVPTNRSWTRDFAPIFVKNRNGRVAATDWRFNGWAKYNNWKKDDAANALLARKFNWKMWEPEFSGRRVVLEGGSIDVNGRGTLLATEECLLSREQERNPGFMREDYEAVFREYFGVKKVLWLKRGIAGDDTHGHVDDLARFVNPRTVVAAIEVRDKSDANYEPLRENWARLREMRDQDGRKLEIVPLPMPRPVWIEGQRLPASYANFYIANKIVLVPTFNDAADSAALLTLGRQFPDRLVVGIHCLDLVLGLGTLHCMTQQEPA